MSGKYPNTFYRISLKAIIRNDKGEVLLVREKGSDGWCFPGGGMDHGENEHEALARELFEEVAIDAPFTAKILGTDPQYIPHHEAWLLWIVYDVTFEGGYSYGKGADADEAAFVDPHTLKDSLDGFERRVYTWAVEKSPR